MKVGDEIVVLGENGQVKWSTNGKMQLYIGHRFKISSFPDGDSITLSAECTCCGKCLTSFTAWFLT